MKVILFCMALVLVVGHSACTSNQKNTPIATPASISSLDGTQLYANNCVRCHEAIPPDKWQALTPSQITEKINKGGGEMPAFSNILSTEKIAAIVQHILNKK